MTDKSFVGWHRSNVEDIDLFVVFRVDDSWYWQYAACDHVPLGMIIGPFQTAEGAYLSAIGD